MNRKSFHDIKYKGANPQEKSVKTAFRAPEQIDIKESYSATDMQGLEHLGFTAGLPPYLRGPYTTMYVMQPWTIRQYAGFSTAEESTAFYRRNLAAGQTHCFLRPC